MLEEEKQQPSWRDGLAFVKDLSEIERGNDGAVAMLSTWEWNDAVSPHEFFSFFLFFSSF